MLFSIILALTAQVSKVNGQVELKKTKLQLLVSKHGKDMGKAGLKSFGELKDLRVKFESERSELVKEKDRNSKEMSLVIEGKCCNIV